MRHSAKRGWWWVASGDFSSGCGFHISAAYSRKARRSTERSLASSRTAYDLGNRLRRLALPVTIQSWSLASLQPRLFKTGGRLVRHARSFRLQLAGSHLTQRLFAKILVNGRLAWDPT